jgi:hypothetical protein
MLGLTVMDDDYVHKDMLHHDITLLFDDVGF